MSKETTPKSSTTRSQFTSPRKGSRKKTASETPDTVIRSLPRKAIEEDYWATTKDLKSLKARLPDWLWKSYNEALDGFDDSQDDGLSGYGRRGVNRVQAFKKIPYTYPARPLSSPTPSSSLDALREVLADAPDRPWSPKNDRSQYLTMHDGNAGFMGVTWMWTDAYCDKIYTALMGVIEEHGLGDDGWKRARWEVYDKYSERLQGISYHSWERWSPWDDRAFDWLRGRIAPEGRNLMITAPRRETEVGLKYNDMLDDST